MKITFLILAAASALTTHVPVRAEAAASLNDARMAIIEGTAPGIVIIGARRSPQQAAAATAPLAERLGALLKWGDPPSGRPLNAARRLDSPTLGIALPSAGSAASQPAGK